MENEMTPEEALREALSMGTVRFTYLKTDGSERSALGTLHPVLLPPRPEPVEGLEFKAPNTGNNGHIPYYDLEVKGWRSCQVARLTGNIKVVSVPDKEGD